jgi:mRNA interferase MazF
MSEPRRGEIWLVDLDPTRGSEIKKTRPVVIISLDDVGILPVRLVVPCTSWQSKFAGKIWCIPVAPTAKNGLNNHSAANVLQTRAIDTERCVQKLGMLEADLLEDVIAALAIVVGFV